MNNPHEQPAPSKEQPTLRIRALAADLAYGALIQLWGSELPDTPHLHSELANFLVSKWNNNYPQFNLLVSFGYLIREQRYGNMNYILTRKAFDLLEKIPLETKVFISYGRNKSSAFALALQYKLISLGIDAFLDKEIDLGDEWHAKLQSKISNCDYFISILAPETLESANVRKEIQWAFESGRLCIPVWHSNFSLEKDLNSRNDLDTLVKKYIQAKNACIVEGKEKAAIYDGAINQIINQLGYS